MYISCTKHSLQSTSSEYRLAIRELSEPTEDGSVHAGSVGSTSQSGLMKSLPIQSWLSMRQNEVSSSLVELRSHSQQVQRAVEGIRGQILLLISQTRYNHSVVIPSSHRRSRHELVVCDKTVVYTPIGYVFIPEVHGCVAVGRAKLCDIVGLPVIVVNRACHPK